MTASPLRILYVITEDWYFWSHRLDLAKAARDAGYVVTIATRVTDHGDRIRQEGFDLVPLPLERRSLNPIREMPVIFSLVRLYQRLRPGLIHHVALKPIVYGSLAATLAKVPVVINAFAGLGYTFMEGTPRLSRWIAKILLKLAMKHPGSIALVQNADDQRLLVQEHIARSDRTRVIPGSGVNIREFSPGPSPAGVPIVLLAARMLWDKGIGEFVEAARLLKRRGCEARFVLVGRRDEHNPAAISLSQLETWVGEGIVEWWGHREDMPTVYRMASVVVLPSYREGLPKVLLEAAACGKTLVATDVPGCREIVRPFDNGLLVPPRNAQALAEAMDALLRDCDRCVAMGSRARELADEEWASEVVTKQVLDLYRELLNRPCRARPV